MGDNVEQLFTAQPAATSSYGWRPSGPDTLDVPQVDYGGQRLLRRTGLSEVMNRVELTPGSRATTLGVAVHADGSSYPWAVSARNLTYIGEVPFSYVDTKDRYLAAADIIERTVAPDTPNRKRALIRIEDVGPNTDPGQIRAIADLLSARGVPFSLATYPYYRDPLGAAHNGTPASFRLVDAPALVDALQYARQRGATIIMHGYSHQYESARNPYDATSGSDFEFYAAHVDTENAVQLDGPVPADSRRWAADRLAIGRAEFIRVGLPDLGIFEFPHYTGSAASYAAVQDAFGVRYDQGTYFAGLCPAGACTTEEVPGPEGLFQQYFPYPVRDVYGSMVIPENIGMPKYLAVITYTAEGLKGLMDKGGTARVEASREFVASAGGSLESLYFALGADDAYIVYDLPDNAAAAATAMSAAATGVVVNRIVPLLTPEELDRAAAARLSYHAPGS